jgi:arginase
MEAGEFSLVLSGNCGSCLGTLGGLELPDLGIIWFDAHGDFNVPDTTTSGFLDGMALAIATGRTWTSLAQTIPGFSYVPDWRVLHIGARDLDEAERYLMETSEMRMVEASLLDEQELFPVAKALDDMKRLTSTIYLHIDLDVLNASEAPANRYAALAPGGLRVDQLRGAILMVRKRFTVAAAAITAYDPEQDPDGKALSAALEVAAAISR